MKTIGLLGGMSWESTVTYYQLINQMVNQQLGGLHSAKLILHSVDFQYIENCQKQGEWDAAGKVLADAALSLQTAGAECIVLCTNTMHKVASHITSKISIPFIHIADATISALQADNIQRVALLGTQYTMTQPFYKERLIDAGLSVLIPEQQAIEKINQIIFTELCKGIISSASKNYFLSVINQLREQGAESVILGCTEIGLLIQSTDTSIPLYDTTYLHAEAAVKWGLGEGYIVGSLSAKILQGAKNRV